MKKVLLLIIMSLFAIESFSQVAKMEMGLYVYITGSDKTKTIHNVGYNNLSGYHSCVEEAKHVRVRPFLSYVFEKTKKGTIKYWQIGFSLYSYKEYAFSMNKRDEILIKLFDDTVINLVTNSVDIRNESGYGTFMDAEAKITDTTLKRLTSKGIKKLRIGTSPFVCDALYEDDTIGVFLKEAIKIINERKNSTTKNNF